MVCHPDRSQISHLPQKPLLAIYRFLSLSDKESVGKSRRDQNTASPSLFLLCVAKNALVR